MGSSKFAILGEDGSGKTCYLLGMYYAMSMDTANYMVVATDPVTDRFLLRRCQMLKDKSRKGNRFPPGTDCVEKFNFNLWHNDETIHSFEWMDYPGGWLDVRERRNLSGSDDYNSFKDFIMNSEMVFICIDGANLTGSSTSQKIRKVKTRCARQINPYLTELRNKLKKEKQGLPPIGMLVTKYDMCIDDTDADEIREIVEEAFEGLFGGNDTFVAIIPVSLGDTLEDDDWQGELDPINVHLPILMGINFALRKQVKKLSEEHIKDINRMNRELEAVEMIFYKGAWQDKHAIRRMWADLQRSADYKSWRY
ncbi:MAG: hypothetical protein IJG33_02230 [Selenomonadaceae bacterium]|nr:hypothetical protein [Selenomonadaceae bacterium]MBQ6005659.1 hypothetical protein [Selenomonadaceae bacterium]